MMSQIVDFQISRNARPQARIEAIPESARAAEILAARLSEITGAALAVSPRAQSGSPVTAGPPDRRILFQMTDQYGKDGYSYAASDDQLLIQAGTGQAFVYAVYDLLEQTAGCRFYTQAETDLPADPDLVLKVRPQAIQPKMFYREVYYRGFEDRSFAEKHKMAPSNKHEGWGFWCHSFQMLIPNETYVPAHPEYFALIDGVRHPKGEPCLSNPAVFAIVRDNLRRQMLERPECRYWSVSQNDDDLYCRCPDCARQDSIDGGPMGSILTFVNKIAAEFPDKVISTLAYWYSRKAPRLTRPAPNVHIMLCNIEALRGLPIATDPRNEGTRQELLDWEKICGNISLWDYCIQFANLVSPFPNLRVLGPNIRFFTEHHVTMLFSQANREIGGEFSALRGYLLAKLMWNPDIDERAVMEDFCGGYYGAASTAVLAYIDSLHDAMEATGGRAGIFEGPRNHRDTYLTRDRLDGYSRLFDQAELAVADDPARLFRVREARLPIRYAAIVLQYGTPEERLDQLRHFAAIARKAGLQKVEEWKITVDQFVTDSLAALAE